MPEALRGPRAVLLLAFASIWLVWGSTFLVIRWAIDGIPPILMCGLRLFAAGAAILVWARATGQPWPRGVEWRNAALVGLLLPGIGNASVTLAISHVPSGLVALLVSTIPLWMGLLATLGQHSDPPGGRAVFGLALGFAGIALLIGPGLVTGHDAVLSPLWALVPVFGSLSWAWGSLWSRRTRLPGSPLVSTGIGLTVAGLALLLLAAGLGDFARWQPAAVPVHAWASLAYLAVFGSVIGFSAYLYLLRRVPPAVVATYAFVNPIVALLLGFLLAGEVLSPRTLAATVVVLGAVLLIVTAPPASRGVPTEGGSGATAGAGALPARRH